MMEMDLYQAAVDYLLTMPAIREWPELQEVITCAAAKRPAHWQLPAFACAAAGGAYEHQVVAVGAIACMHLSIMLIDDMLDDDPRGEYRRLGYPSTANMTAALQAGGLQALTQSDVETRTAFAATRSLNQMMLCTALGQHWDVLAPQNEAAYWRMMHTKSASFFGACLEVGGILGYANEQVARGLRTVGELYGEIVQIQDDLNDVMETPANPDWLLNRSPLPILFAQVVSHPERERFLALRQQITAPQNLVAAQEILIRCGALSYCVDQVLRRHQAALAVLDTLALHDREILANLFSAAIEPVYRLLAVATSDIAAGRAHASIEKNSAIV